MKIGIDLGGTNMRAAEVCHTEIVRSLSRPTPRDGGAQAVVDALVKQIAEIIEAVPEPCEGIGVGVPSVVDSERGIVYNAMNIPSWREVPLGYILHQAFHLPVAVNNDANCFTLGEATVGSAREYRDVVGLTLGTGVGAGIIIDGKLYSGRNTCAGELCSLPYRGYDYEHFCSSGFFVDHGTTGADAARAAREGDAEALNIWREFGENIAALVSATLLCYDPQAIVFGGSIAKAFELFEPSMRQALQAFPYPTVIERIKIFPSTTPDVALYGAAHLV